MQREKGVAYCGLVCAFCSKNVNCAGCRNDGCETREWCKNLQCCVGKGLEGCWECDEYPCNGGMLDNIRIRAFAKFIREHDQEFLLECLENNEKRGISYHYPGELTGDYDAPDTEDGIIDMILGGNIRMTVK